MFCAFIGISTSNACVDSDQLVASFNFTKNGGKKWSKKCQAKFR